MLVKSCCSILITLSCFLFTSAHAIQIVTEENSPFNFIDPETTQLTGIAHEVLVEAFKRANIPYTPATILPWARAYEMARADANVCVHSTARLPDREHLFQWIGPVSRSQQVMFAKKSFMGTLKNLDDAKKYKIGGLLKDAPTATVQSNGLEIELVSDHKLNVQKLASGRIDLWAVGLSNGYKAAGDVGYKDLKPVLVFKEVRLYLACNPAVPANIVKALNDAIQKMQTEGMIDKINDRYLKRYEALIR